ncbi:conjugal transfer protein TraG N-terminal domain-containing protein [Rodentibacter pneumotropicus]|uniref:Conjugal transfer protein TraG n=1 Tax=Rodentibacter pneumotropicus TaxID=758 RepID=A0A4S2Q4E0_9PAST|nr:conjugal transfer protein TraG N-terminal domain-containing protein [Rodentibacter pneumotropicus]THA11004.1 conjugal transfer protein TraG [Rodentibacter pneumotropicus]
MSIYLTVDSYYEYFLTLLGWIISNGIWDLMIDTGAWAIPFLAHIIRLFIKAREQGDDEGNKGKLLAAWIENAVYGSLIVMVFTCLPLFNVSYSTLQFDTERMKECGYSVRKPSDLGMKGLSSELSGQTASLPLWWAFMYTVGKGFTHGAIATIPCKPDLRQLRFDVQHTRIQSPVLRQEIQQFAEDCFLPSRAKIKRQKIDLDEAQSRDLDWIGSSLLVNTPGFYDVYRAKTPQPFWPYELPRDDALPNTGNGGYPSCKVWWVDPNVGLRQRIIDTVDDDVFLQLRKAVSDDLYAEGIETVIRSIVRPNNLKVSNGDPVYMGYGNNTGVDGVYNYVMSGLGMGFTGFVSFPAFDAMRQSLPMVQGLLSLAVIIAMPLIMVIGLYSVRAMITLTFVHIGIFFLSFWWELARWLDTWLIEVLYNSDTHSRWNLAGLVNERDDMIVKLVIATMFFILPALWFGMMSWTGIKVGNVVGDAVSRTSNGQVQNQTQSGAKDVVKRG